MQNVRNWSLYMCLISVGCTMIELLLPPGKMSKTMYTILSLFILCCGISSFNNLRKDCKHILPDLVYKSKLKKSSELLNSIDSQVVNLACENIKTVVSRRLKDIGIVPKKIEIFMDTITDNCILMIRCKIYIENEFKDLKSKIYETITEKLNIQTEIIEV